MRYFWYRGPLLDEVDVDEGTGTGTAIDPGTPFEHDNLVDDEDVDDKKTPAPDAKALAAENDRLKQDLERERTDKNFWAERAARAPQPVTQQAPIDEAEEDDEPAVPKRVAKKPEEFLTDVASKGEEALREAGFVRMEDVQALVDKAVKGATKQSQQYTDATREDAEFAQKVDTEFPEIAAEVRRFTADKSYKSTNPLYIETTRIYNQMLQDDPGLANRRGTLFAAARHAKDVIAARGGKGAGTNTVNREQERRTRIERNQPSGRSGAADRDDNDRSGGHTPEQLQVMKMLKVTPEQFNKKRDADTGGKRRRA